MPRRRTPYRDPLLVEVLAYLGAGTFEARPLIDEDHPNLMRVYGLCEPGVITINEGEHVVETLLHEILHAVRPHWTERGVRRRTRFLVTLRSKFAGDWRTNQTLRTLDLGEAIATAKRWVASQERAS